MELSFFHISFLLHSRPLIEHGDDDDDIKKRFKVVFWKMLMVGGVNVEHEFNGEERCSTLVHQCQYQYFVCKWSNTHCPVEKVVGRIFRKP